MKTAWIFPGQGAQTAEMGLDFYRQLPTAQFVFDRADEVLQRPLTPIIFEGPAETLGQTENTQAAMLTTCVAIARVLQEAGVPCDATAGLSLGEYSALVTAGAMSFDDAVRVVQDRGRYMQEAVPVGEGGMTAVLGLSEAAVEQAVREGKEEGFVAIANYNAPGQIVLTGSRKGLKAAGEAAQRLGAKKCVPLDVSAPFHSLLLKEAAERLEARLADVSFSDPSVRVYSNVSASPTEDAQALPGLLAAQVTSSVLWQQSVEKMLEDGVTRFIEIGPGKTLTAFVKRIAKQRGSSVTLWNVATVEDWEALKEALSEEIAG